LLDGGQQKRQQDGDNGHDDQNLYDREPVSFHSEIMSSPTESSTDPAQRYTAGR
jgi:hypothetical protein